MWDISRTLSLSGAGVATALILLLAQIWSPKVPLQISMWSAVVALPLWIGFWQICESYLLWDDSARSHFERPGMVVSLTLYFLVNCLTLFVGVTALIWNFLPAAAVGFMVISAVVAIVVGVVCHSITRAALEQ